MLWQGEGNGEVSYFVLQCIQVLREVRVLILQLISPLPDLAHSSLVLTHLVLEKKKELKLGQRASKHRQKPAFYLARTAIAARVLLRPWRRAQAMELALRLTSWLRMEGKDISMLCRSSSRSRTQLSHTARGTQHSARGPLPGLPAPRSPALQYTDLHTSCCLGRWPPGSRSRACRRRTASPSARWSRCTPRCVGHRSPLCTRTLPSVTTGKGPCHHSVLLPRRREGKRWFYSSCAIASLDIYVHGTTGGFPVCSDNTHRTPNSS